jgi:uncharacterized tellurite resistance protein B-like protein
MDDRVARCLLISKVLVADGIMTDDERSFLARAMETFGLSEEEQTRVINLENWGEAEPIVARMSAADKQELLDQLTGAALVDGQLSKLELEVVKRISEALDLDA